MPRTFKARPTTDFAKENLFNILSNLLDFASCTCALDLFAGTGSISVELLSRGCPQVVSVEKDYAHYAFIQKVKKELGDAGWLPVKADVFAYIKRCPQQFNFIFADPPYALENLAELPDLVFSNGLLQDEGLFVLEHGSDHTFAEHPRFMQEREYGSVHFSFFQ